MTIKVIILNILLFYEIVVLGHQLVEVQVSLLQWRYSTFADVVGSCPEVSSFGALNGKTKWLWILELSRIRDFPSLVLNGDAILF